MLVHNTNTHAPNTIVAVKTDKQEVIGRVVNQRSGDEIVLKTPLVIQPIQDHSGALHIAFMPFVMTADDDEAFVFNGQIFIPRQDVRDGYIKQTSNLVLPDSKLILPN